MNYQFFSKSILKFLYDTVPYNRYFRLVILKKLNYIIPSSQLTFTFLDINHKHVNTVNLRNVEFKNMFNESFYKIGLFTPENINNLFDIEYDKVFSLTLSNSNLLSNSKYENTKFYKDFLERENLYYFAVIHFKISEDYIGRISLFNSKEKGAFSENSLYLLESFKTWIKIRTTEYFNVYNHNNFSSMLTIGNSYLETGIVLLDDNLNVLFKNTIAENRINKIFNNSIGKYRTEKDIFNSIFNKITLHKINYETFLSLLFENLTIDILIINSTNFLDKKGKNYILYLKELEKPDGLTILNSKNFFLTNRENEVAELILKGLSNKEIAEYLNISINTVRTHIDRILSKTGSNNKSSAIFKLCNNN